MPIDEARRIQLHDAARDRLGPEAALTLMEMLPPVGWADVATKHDLEHLEQRIDHRFGEVDHRFELLETRLEARIEAALSRNLRWTVTTMVALTAVVTTIVTAITQLA